MTRRSGEMSTRRVRATRNRLLKQQGYRCYYCQKVLQESQATLEHIKPLAAGGSNKMCNLAAACLECNLLKGVEFSESLIASSEWLVEWNERMETLRSGSAGICISDHAHLRNDDAPPIQG